MSANSVTEKPTHTPGPWETDGGVMVVSSALKGRVHWTDKDGQEHNAQTGLIALVYSCSPEGDYETGRLEANASLIAAAPDLLAALKMLIEHSIILDECGDAVRAAIAKAEGR